MAAFGQSPAGMGSQPRPAAAGKAGITKPSKAAAVRDRPSCRRYQPIAPNINKLQKSCDFPSSESTPATAATAATAAAMAHAAVLLTESGGIGHGEQYDPESPWGAKGITYDPTSPHWTWKPKSPAPASEPLPTDTAEHSIFKELRTAASLLGPDETDTAPETLSNNVTASSGSILQILHDIESMPTSRAEADDLMSSFVADTSTSMPHRFAVKEDAQTPPSTAGGKKRVARKSGTAKAARKNNTEDNKQSTSPRAGPSRAETARCCPVEVPSILHMILDRTGDKLDPHMIEQYSELSGKLCEQHLKKYRCLKASMERKPDAPACSETMLSLGAMTSPVELPGVQPVRKKRRPSAEPHRLGCIPKAIGRSGLRPVPNVIRDSQYRRQVLLEIEEQLARSGSAEDEQLTHGAVTNRTVYNLLMVAKQPNILPERGPVDAHFLTGEEARAMLEAGSPAEPVVTDKEQAFRWQSRLRPTAELFRRMENLDRQVSVQVPSRSCMEDSFESRELEEVRERFLGSGRTQEIDDPWNILDLRSPIPAAVLPQFLTCENCQLLPRLRDEVLSPGRAERDTGTREQWNEWRDVLEWVLLSQGGHNTSPHTDSHGLATWITVQEGLFGYGWLSRPTAEEHGGWAADPQGFTGGRWCYLILEPGQTVFFNSGTVHFVFRLRSEQTLALGGHVLQWTGIERWLQVVAAQMRNPHITNEDMEWSAPKYVRLVARLVEMRLRNGRVVELGGEPAMRRLLVLLKEFDETYMKDRPRMKPKRRKHR